MCISEPSSGVYQLYIRFMCIKTQNFRKVKNGYWVVGPELIM